MRSEPLGTTPGFDGAGRPPKPKALPREPLADGVDFAKRADPTELPERMDGPCSYEEFRACVRDIAASSLLTFAYRPIRRFVAQALAGHDGVTPLRIVDVGSGGGDLLRRLALFARRRRYAVELFGIDLNPFGTRAAAELSASDPRFRGIAWITGDVLTEESVQSPDLVLSSLVTHHMRDEEIVRFLRWMEASAQTGWLISDLVRSPRSYRLFGLLSRALRWHPFVQHDGLVSIRRAFREPDWERLLTAAGIPRASVTLQRGGLGRLCISRFRRTPRRVSPP